jgi:RNA-directed DNA polymerase
MRWNTYEKKFTKEAKKAGFQKKEIESCLAYALNLYNKKLPIIFEEQHLSLLVGYKVAYIMGVANSPGKYYREFFIPKRNGGFRKIAEPLPNLKDIQKWILTNILEKIKISGYCKSFRKNQSIKDNAKYHKKASQVLTVDIQNFFDSTKFKHIKDIFRNCGYSEYVSCLLTNICCLSGSLPQGAPTSPMLSNIYLASADQSLADYCRNKEIRYTRYADDLTFSGNFQFAPLIKFVEDCLKQKELNLNHGKTRLMKKHQRQEVTGILVNEKLQAPKAIRKKLRQEIYYIRKYSLQSHMKMLNIEQAHYLNHLLGIANYILFINPNDKKTQSYLGYLHDLKLS